MISVLYEHVDTSIDDRLELVSFNELRLDALAGLDVGATCPTGLPEGSATANMALRVSDMLRLLDA